MGSLRNGAVEPNVRFAILIQILSGGSCLDLMLGWHIARTTVYDIFHATVTVILAHLKFDDFPSSDDACSKLGSEFASSRTTADPLYGCVRALDGISVRI